MKFIDFMQVFPDEESCERKQRKYRGGTQGIVCPHCGGKEHYWKGDKKCFECKRCHYRQGLLTSMKKSFSAAECQRQLCHKNYMPIWAMLHKLRNAMGKRNAGYKVCGMVELDEGFFSTEVPDSEKDKPLKRGHGRRKPRFWCWRRQPKVLRPRNRTASSTSRCSPSTTSRLRP